MTSAMRQPTPEQEPRRPMLREVPPEDRKNIVTGSLWMVGLSILLFFVPGINGLVGGFVGGYKVGGVQRALLAAVLPALVVAAGLWALMAVMDLGVLGLFAGLAIGGVILFSDIGLFIGAAIGGAVSNKKNTSPY